MAQRVPQAPQAPQARVLRHFIMLSGASCAGKTTLLRSLEGGLYALLESDVELCGRIFGLIGEPGLSASIDQTDAWRARVGAKVDCDRLLRLHVRDFLYRHQPTPHTVADGFVFMFRWFRDLTRAALVQLPHEDFRLLLVHYEPPLEEHIARFMKRTGCPREHSAATVAAQRARFEAPSAAEGLDFVCVADADGFRKALKDRGILSQIRAAPAAAKAQ
jgi:hypothetical protein